MLSLSSLTWSVCPCRKPHRGHIYMVWERGCIVADGWVAGNFADARREARRVIALIRAERKETSGPRKSASALQVEP